MLELNLFGLIQIKFSITKSYFKNIYKILINDKLKIKKTFSIQGLLISSLHLCTYIIRRVS